ncbi:hypothetical protein GGF44_002362, partial [Coemansia sp. RSA 1694]
HPVPHCDDADYRHGCSVHLRLFKDRARSGSRRCIDGGVCHPCRLLRAAIPGAKGVFGIGVRMVYIDCWHWADVFGHWHVPSHSKPL